MPPTLLLLFMWPRWPDRNKALVMTQLLPGILVDVKARPNAERERERDVMGGGRDGVSQFLKKGLFRASLCGIFIWW